MVKIRELIKYFRDKELKIIDLKVDLDTVIVSPKNITEAIGENLTFLNRKYENQLEHVLSHCKSRIIIVESGISGAVINAKILTGVAIIISPNPKKDLIDAVNYFFPVKRHEPHIDKTSSIDDSCKLGKNIYIGPFVVIEEDVIVGDGCVIESNVVIKSGTRIGKNVHIKPCSVIGGIGFGYDKNANETMYELLPHFGRVIIEDDVDIGSNTCIDKGSLSDTIIKRGVKIDNLVHIAHNVTIGENTLVIACSMVAGSVVIGENSWIAPSASIRNGLTIGKNCTIGFGSVLTNNIEDNSTVLGVPAMDIEDFKFLRNHQKSILKSKNNH
jgi:UDP-3-O-[3-hydroxymyristoyl] glucosamine N-acyltransferase